MYVFFWVFPRRPGKYPKEYIQDSKHGESLKSRVQCLFCFKVEVNDCWNSLMWKTFTSPFYNATAFTWSDHAFFFTSFVKHSIENEQFEYPVCSSVAWNLHSARPLNCFLVSEHRNNTERSLHIITEFLYHEKQYKRVILCLDDQILTLKENAFIWRWSNPDVFTM